MHKAVAHLNIELEERFQWYLDNRLTPQLLSIKDEEGKGFCEESALRSSYLHNDQTTYY